MIYFLTSMNIFCLFFYLKKWRGRTQKHLSFIAFRDVDVHNDDTQSDEKWRSMDMLKWNKIKLT